jgi:hypothetical protein
MAKKNLSRVFFLLMPETEQSYLFDRYIDWNTRQSIDKGLGTRTTKLVEKYVESEDNKPSKSCLKKTLDCFLLS